MRDLFLEVLRERATADKRIMLITADLGFKVLDRFREELPSQFLNIGIAEQNMIGVASGLALSGKIIFVYSIANFSSLRCLEQIRNDACYHNANVKVVSVGAGLSYGQLGISHHATEDISIMRSLPSISVFSPGDDSEVIGCTNQMIDQDGTAYIRLDREGVGCLEDATENFMPGATRKIRCGQKIALISTGGMLGVALEVAKRLEKNNIEATILSVPVICPLETQKLIEISRSHQYLYTLEEHSIHGGLGGLVAETLMESDFSKPRFYRFGLREGFSSVVGDQQYLRARYKIDATSIHSHILSDLKPLE